MRHTTRSGNSKLDSTSIHHIIEVLRDEPLTPIDEIAARFSSSPTTISRILAATAHYAKLRKWADWQAMKLRREAAIMDAATTTAKEANHPNAIRIIEAARRDPSRTLDSLAEATGVSRSTVSRVIAGTRMYSYLRDNPLWQEMREGRERVGATKPIAAHSIRSTPAPEKAQEGHENGTGGNIPGEGETGLTSQYSPAQSITGGLSLRAAADKVQHVYEDGVVATASDKALPQHLFSPGYTMPGLGITQYGRIGLPLRGGPAPLVEETAEAEEAAVPEAAPVEEWRGLIAPDYSEFKAPPELATATAPPVPEQVQDSAVVAAARALVAAVGPEALGLMQIDAVDKAEYARLRGELHSAWALYQEAKTALDVFISDLLGE